MAIVRTIYFKDEVWNQLKNEGNMSGLINSLLEIHYGTRDIKEKESIKQKLNELDGQRRVWQDALIRFTESEKAEALLKEAEEKAKRDDYNKWKKSPERWEKMKPILRDAFKRFEATNEQFEEFMSMAIAGEVKSPAEYCNLKGIKRKERKNV